MGRPPQTFVSAGQQFGRGIVTNPEVKRNRRGALLRCDCDSEYWASVSDLLAGKVSSCGCLWRQKMTTGRQGTENPNFRHGHHSYPLYGAWGRMIDRCENPDNRHYLNYGGRGIRVCERWHDVQLFAEDIDRLIGPRPASMTLDRIDNDGGYEPGNVRWATAKEQRANQRPYGSGALATVKKRRAA